MLEDIRNDSKVVGVKQSLKVLEKGNAKTVFIAKDADEKVIRSIIELCQKNSVQVIYVDTMKQLGKACGIEVGAAVACVTGQV